MQHHPVYCLSCLVPTCELSNVLQATGWLVKFANQLVQLALHSIDEANSEPLMWILTSNSLTSV